MAVSECRTSTSSGSIPSRSAVDLRPRRLVALAVGRRPGDHLDGAGGQDPHGGGLPAAGPEVERGQDPAGGEAAHLDVGGDADAEVLGVPRVPAALLLRPDVVVTDQLERPVERGRVVAGVVGEAGDRLVGELVGRDVVAAPDLDPVDPDRPGQRVHRPLEGVGGLGAPRAPVGVGRRAVGEHAGALEVVRRHVVHAVVQERPEQRDPGRDQLQVGAHVRQQVGPHRSDPAVGVGGQLHVLDLAAALDGGDRVLRAALVPAGGDAEAPGHGHGDQLLRVDVELGPEATTHRRGDDPQLVLGHAAGGGDHHLEDVGDLGRRVDGEVAAVHAGDRGNPPRLEGPGDEPLLHVGLADRVGGGRERGVDRGGVGRQRPRVGLVGAEAVVDDGAVAGRLLEVGHRGQRVVVDDDSVRGVGRPVAAVGHDHGDDVADVAGLVRRQREVLGRLHVLGDGPGARHGRRPGVPQVGGGEHLADARHLERGAGVDAADAGVGVGAADHGEPDRPGDLEVVDEPGLAGEQPGVLLAQEALAEGTTGRSGLGAGVGGRHAETPSPAADITARTMLW